jgi:phosphate transport system substrate-binding protein
VTRRISRPLAAAVLIPLAAILAACSSSSPSSTTGASAPAYKGPANPTAPAKASASITETGSTLLFPLVGSWVTAYSKLFPQVTITSAGTGSGVGIADATSGTVNIGGSDAYLSPADTSKDPSLLNIALAISAQQINYNVPGVKTPLKLDAAVLVGMYTGKITNWDDPAVKALNPGVSLPNLKVVPVHRADSSGDTFLFTSFLNSQDPSGWSDTNVDTTVTWPSVPGALGEQGNSGMVAACGANKGCIAYIGISYAAKTAAAGLGQALLKNAAGNYVAPTSTSISAAANALTAKTPANEAFSMINGPAATGYPIVNYEYAIVSKSQPSATTTQDIRAFLDWAVTTGNLATYLDPVDFQPLPGPVVSLSEKQIAEIG